MTSIYDQFIVQIQRSVKVRLFCSTAVPAVAPLPRSSDIITCDETIERETIVSKVRMPLTYLFLMLDLTEIKMSKRVYKKKQHNKGHFRSQCSMYVGYSADILIIISYMDF